MMKKQNQVCNSLQLIRFSQENINPVITGIKVSNTVSGRYAF